MKAKLLVFLAPLFVTGCLTFKTVEYDLTVNKDLSAKGKVIFRGIGSDVVDAEQRALDLEGLYDYGLKSQDFIKDRKTEGKIVTGRKLYVKDDLLVAEIDFTVKHVGEIEGFYINDNFIYIDVDKDSELNAANGDVNIYGGGKQVLWKKGAGKIKYTVSVFSDEQWAPFSLTQEYLTRYGSKK
ncbi:MAG: hypothetical protein J0L62_08075 [Bacteroidetes bacterium]|nr:hypothetical protein [Bacteroidota bacterium]